jgi:hypothetical protein
VRICSVQKAIEHASIDRPDNWSEASWADRSETSKFRAGTKSVDFAGIVGTSRTSASSVPKKLSLNADKAHRRMNFSTENPTKKTSLRKTLMPYGPAIAEYVVYERI